MAPNRVVIVAALAAVVLTGCRQRNGQVAAGSPSRTPSLPASSSEPAATQAAAAATGATTASVSAPATSAITPSPQTPAVSATTATQTPTIPTPTAAGAAGRFVASTAAVTAAELGKSWHAGCPIGPAQLRTVTLTYWGFDSAPHTGRLVVAASVVPAVIQIFGTLFAEHFPVRSVRPTADFGGSDDASMAADNTSGFNCRYAVAPGAPRWSAHAYGKAIDVNTIEKPYLEGGKVLPPEGAPYLERTPYRPGMAVANGQLVTAFATAGWQWGGRWTSSPDYQHFSADGG
jgi:hypothetical protein